MAAAPFMTRQGPVGPCRKGFQNSFSLSEMMMKVRAQTTGQPIALHEAGQAMMDYKESLAIIGLRLDNNVRVPATSEFDGGAFNAQAGNPASRRWVFKDSVSRREAIVVDVLAIKVAPVEVCQIPPKAAAGSAGGGGGGEGGGDGDDGDGGEEGEGAQPLLVVRYSDVRRGGITPAHNASYTDLMSASVSGADEDAASVEGKEGGTENGMEGFLPTVLKEHSTAGSRIEAVNCSPQELAIIFRFLETNANLIGAKTLGAWRGASKHNRGGKASNKKVKAGGKKEKVGASSSSGGAAVGGGLFTLSFIVPPTNGNSKVAEGENICAVCKSSCTLSCSRCKTAHYCSREHQREHWKKHKRVCGKSAEELSGGGRLSSGGGSGGGGGDGAGNGDRDSVLVPVVDPKMAAEGRVMMTMGQGSMAQDGSMNTSRGAKETTREMKDKVRNVHGDATFLVKCQVPMMGVVGGAAGLMCYDERRSFTTIIAGDSAAGKRLAALIRSEHRHSVRRVKGYFEATMEGAVLRIFVDDLAEPQVW